MSNYVLTVEGVKLGHHAHVLQKYTTVMNTVTLSRNNSPPQLIIEFLT